jgi:hypothetical protein
LTLEARMSIAWVPLLALGLLVTPFPAAASVGRSYSSSNSSKPSKSKSKCATCPRDSHGKIKRSAKAKDDFRRAQPCPGGRDQGSTRRCSGYVIDHVKPLECGGADAPSNMQWQTVAAAKAKDRTERTCR